jgi:hypothetical protein
VRVRVDKALDEEIRREAAMAAETTIQSYLFQKCGEVLAEIIKDDVVEEVAAVYSSYKIQVPWGLQTKWVSDVRKWVRDRVTVSMEEGNVSVDVRTSVEGMSCEVPEERFVALKMLQDG